MNIQYCCELYFENEKSSREKLLRLGLQNLGFSPKIMSIYVNAGEIYEEVSYDEDLLFSIISRENDCGIKITQDLYNENTISLWFRLSEIEGRFFSIKWSNINMDFLFFGKVGKFLEMDGFTAGYIFENKDAWEQTRDGQVKEYGSLNFNNYPGQFKYVCGMQFMAAPLMWFGSPFFKIISKRELLSFKQAKELNTGVVQLNLFDIYDSPKIDENRRAQREFWCFFELDKVISKYDKENHIDAVQSLNNFLSKNKPKSKR